MILKPFFSFYGSKWRVAPYYPAPQHSLVIEPFAGSAGYSLRYFQRQVVLVEKDPRIAALWSWLIRVTSREVMQLPDVVDCVDDMVTSQESRWLVGFWLNQGSAQPKKRRSKSASFKGGGWNAAKKQQIARQVDQIKHWRVALGTYEQIANATATWFIDPPYQIKGIHYRCSSKDINYTHLGTWCRERNGQVIVCENAGADWLPFQPFGSFAAASSQGVAKRSEEVIWTNVTR